MNAALQVEWMKIRRSSVSAVAAVLMSIGIPFLGFAFYSVAQRSGDDILSQKAAAFVVGEGWVGFLGSVDQIAAVGIFLGVGIVATWMFGREHVERTFPALFALPVSRSSIATAKFVVLGLWSMLMTGLLCLVVFIVGVVFDVASAGGDGGPSGLARTALIAIAASALGWTAALVASAWRGYLPAFLGIILAILAAQVAVLFGTGGWFPFAVPGLAAIARDTEFMLTWPQMATVPITVVIACWMTVRWWARAEVV